MIQNLFKQNILKQDIDYDILLADFIKLFIDGYYCIKYSSNTKSRYIKLKILLDGNGFYWYNKWYIKQILLFNDIINVVKYDSINQISIGYSSNDNYKRLHIGVCNNIQLNIIYNILILYLIK